MQTLDRAGATLEHIPVFVPRIGVDTLKHLTDAFDVGWLGMGATTKEFEERIAAYLGLEGRYVVATNTGTSALHIALLAAGAGPGDEVIVPSFNYVADHQAIRYTGAEVVMCDIRDDDLGIDCAKARSLITKRTKAILPLHFAGIPCDRAGVYDLAREFGLRVVEDACHGFGSTIDGKKIGSYGDIACFSFDPVKIITSIDGGCVVVNSEDELRKLHHLRILGVDKDTTERYRNARAWEYDVVDQGFRYHLTNIMASVGISQIKQIDDFIASRREICERYSTAFAELRGARVLRRDYGDVSPFIYSLRVLGGRRAELIAHLKERNIAAGIHFMPVHQHTYFASCRRGDMTVTEKAAAEVVTLPLHSHMKEASIQRVIDAVTSFFA
ncbi:MAG TPA: DegT/DnrJ/EryC1/StrS family aminotransferase [Candidatus Baltobacteraceae bacterium]|nr:DegT/DnrJ/EryC1/StrS family aminotransferase [Candidatus Baltobacteraceae bacterium]